LDAIIEHVKMRISSQVKILTIINKYTSSELIQILGSKID
jgi:hypothetical protein